LNVTDFGKNTFQCEIGFKFDCLSPEAFLILGNALASRNPSWYFGKDGQHGLILTTGDGGRERPFYQVKFASDKAIFWAGWYVSYDAWLAWCRNTINDLGALAKEFPSFFISQLSTQAGILVPFAKIKKFSTENTHLKPLVDFYRSYIPEPYLSKGASHIVFSTDDFTRTIETQAIGNAATQESSFNFLHRWTTVNPQLSIAQNVADHLSAFDEHFRKYHDVVLRAALVS